MMTDFETCREALDRLVVAKNDPSNRESRNEAATRLHLIDRLLFECLGWERSDCRPEHAVDGQYVDYVLLTQGSRRVFVIEAKKEGISFELPVGYKRSDYKISSLKKDEPRVFSAIQQAMNYCYKMGVPTGAVSNGHQLVCFLAVRDDGISPIDGKAIVFDSLEAMSNRFLELWQYLSKSGIVHQRLKTALLGESELALPTKLSASIRIYPGHKNRNTVQVELETLANLVIEDFPNNREVAAEFIEDCYCDSGALSQYALVSKNILESRDTLLFDEELGHPPLTPAVDKEGISRDIIATSLSQRPILLLGDRGVGKTMFVRRLISRDAADLLRRAISIYIDFGSQVAVDPSMQLFFVRTMREQLLDIHGIDVDEDSFVRGVYHGELKRFSTGIFGRLKESDQNQYRTKQIEFLSDKLKSSFEHLRQSLLHLQKGRRKQIVLFLDNVDQRSDEIQEEAFILAQELAQNWPMTVFLSIRPQTFYRSKKFGGALSGYNTRAFNISPPRVDQVILKRLEFAKKIAVGDVRPVTLPEGIKIHLPKLLTYLNVLQRSLEKNHDLIEFVENVSNTSIRDALDFVLRFLGSGHVNTLEIFEIEEQSAKGINSPYIIPLHHFERAIFFGDGIHYDPNSSPVCNVFDISRLDPKEHFLLSILLEYVDRESMKAGSNGFVELPKVSEILQAMGFLLSQSDSVTLRALTKRLIEAEARRLPSGVDDLPGTIRLTPLGAYHTKKLIKQFTYIDAIVVDTPILDEQFRSVIVEASTIEERLRRAKHFLDYLDSCWGALQRNLVGFDWTNVSLASRAEIEKIEVRIRVRKER